MEFDITDSTLKLTHLLKCRVNQMYEQEKNKETVCITLTKTHVSSKYYSRVYFCNTICTHIYREKKMADLIKIIVIVLALTIFLWLF